MGVNNLWSILAPVKKHQSLVSLRGQTIAVDLSMWVCASLNVPAMQGIVVKPHLRNLFFRVSNLLQLGVKLVFVLDGEAPELKWEEIARRTQARYPGGNYATGRIAMGGRSYFQVLLNECQEMLSYLGIPCVQSKGEAEAMCAVLNSAGVVDACLTEDGDTFLYGAHTVYRNFTLDPKDPHVDSYSMTDIEQDLWLDREKLVALALLVGCDYLTKGIAGVGEKKAFNLMSQFRGIRVLERFESWADGRMSADCTQLPKKKSHCSLCNHVGTDKQHQRRGCDMCGIPCQPNSDTDCSCAWHKAESQMDGTPLERKIMGKALETVGFPFKTIIREFLENCETGPSFPLHWNRPQLQQMQEFMIQQMNWSESKTMEKVFPLITLWHLTNGIPSSNTESIKLESFIKTRTVKGVSCIEVQWIRPDWNGKDDNSQFFNTTEREDLLAACYPDKYKRFKEEKDRKKAKTPKKKKDTPPPNRITKYFQKRKATSQLETEASLPKHHKQELPLTAKIIDLTEEDSPTEDIEEDLLPC